MIVSKFHDIEGGGKVRSPSGYRLRGFYNVTHTFSKLELKKSKDN